MASLKGLFQRPLSLICALAMALIPAFPLAAQTNTRLLLSSGDAVPEHSGFAFGPFSGLAMNGRHQIVFLTSMVSPRTQLNAVVRSAGVSFSVVAFQGLRSPDPGKNFDSFGSPAINLAGEIAFGAALRDGGSGNPAGSGVFLARGSNIQALATTSQPSPDGSNFAAFSDPILTSSGDVLFSAQTGHGSGFYEWTPGGIEQVPLPTDFPRSAQGLLSPIFSGGNQAVLVPVSADPAAARDQLFRALAGQIFQGINPPPATNQTMVILAAAPSAPPVPMLLVAADQGKIQVMFLEGNPSQAVSSLTSATPGLLPFGSVEGEAAAPHGNILFIATIPGQAPGVGLYCYCQGQVEPLTTPLDFASISATLAGRPLSSLTTDSKSTAAFIAPTGPPGVPSNAIYVTPIPMQ